VRQDFQDVIVHKRGSGFSDQGVFSFSDMFPDFLRHFDIRGVAGPGGLYMRENRFAQQIEITQKVHDFVPA